MAINKIDLILNKEKLLPHINFLKKKKLFKEIIPISAKKNTNIDILSYIIKKNLPVSVHYFPANYFTNSSKIFMISEIIREKLMRFLGNELPYIVRIKIKYLNNNNLDKCKIYSYILVEKINQKKILIGNKGSKIKLISMKARKDIEILINKKVYLILWVKLEKK